MEASRVDELVNRAIDEQIREYRQWREEAAALVARVDALEAAVEALRNELATVVETAAGAGVAGEIDRLSADLRRQISDLGRLIVNDLGRLPKLLATAQEAAAPAATDAGASDMPDVPDEVDLREPGGGIDLPYAVGGGERRGLFRRR